MLYIHKLSLGQSSKGKEESCCSGCVCIFSLSNLRRYASLSQGDIQRHCEADACLTVYAFSQLKGLITARRAEPDVGESQILAHTVHSASWRQRHTWQSVQYTCGHILSHFVICVFLWSRHWLQYYHHVRVLSHQNSWQAMQVQNLAFPWPFPWKLGTAWTSLWIKLCVQLEAYFLFLVSRLRPCLAWWKAAQ